MTSPIRRIIERLEIRGTLALAGSLVALGALVILLVARPWSAGPPGDGAPELPSSINLEQWETQPSGGWITGALNQNNSDYAEGEVVPFRLVIPEKIDPGAYQFSVCRNYEDGDRRAYLFLDAFDASRAADAGGAIGSTSGPFSAVNATIDSVNEVGGQGACKAGDRETIVTITKAAGDAHVLWGGHLAAPDDLGVGEGNGAASWPGASLHMKLVRPSKDVQIMVNALIAPTPTPSPTATPVSDTPTAEPTSTQATGTVTPEPTGTATPSATPTVTSEETPAPTDTAVATATVPPSTATPGGPVVPPTSEPPTPPGGAPEGVAVTPRPGETPPAGGGAAAGGLPPTGSGAGSDGGSLPWVAIAATLSGVAALALLAASGGYRRARQR